MRDKLPELIKLGQNIRTKRKELGLSQEDLAFKAGLDRTYIGGIERGERNVSILNLCLIAYTLGVPSYTLLDGVTYTLQKG